MIDRDAIKLCSDDPDETYRKLTEMMGYLPSWDCVSCEVPQRGPDPGGKICLPCQQKKKREAWCQMPRAEILTRAKVPDEFRGEPPWSPDDWPRDPRRQDLDPATWWPSRVVELLDDRSLTGPRSLTMRGCNGGGKSHRAADLVFRLHRAGIWPAFWVEEDALVYEEENANVFDVRPLWNAALKTTVVVVDDILSTEGNRGRVKDALDLIFNIVKARTKAMSLVTIYTTHRALGPGKDENGKAKENPHCVKALHPGIYSRIRKGMHLNCGDDVDHRGSWTK